MGNNNKQTKEGPDDKREINKKQTKDGPDDEEK